jgi:hypothetical protein
MTLIQILNAVLAESGFLERTSFAASADVDDKQMIAIANRVANTIVDFYKWSALLEEHTITMTSDKVYPLPADYAEIVPDSVWETDGSRRVELPTPDGRWYMYKFSAYSDGGTLRARLMGNNIELYDVQPGESFAFEYRKKSAITDSGDVTKLAFDNDNDKWILEPEMLIRGIQAKWGHAKMMPQYQEWKRDFMEEMNSAIGRDAGGRTIGGYAQDKAYIDSRSPYYPLYRR